MDGIHIAPWLDTGSAALVRDLIISVGSTAIPTYGR